MKSRNRPVLVFSLSFLDVMSVGLGAVILLFMIIHHATEVQSREAYEDIQAEVDALKAQLIDRLQTADALAHAIERAEAELTGARARLQALQRELDAPVTEDAEVAAQRAEMARLQAEVRALERRVADLRAEQREVGDATLRRLDDGDRQYLTGLSVGGQRLLFLVDTSASMLAETVVDIIRRRNMAESEQRSAHKWQRTVNTMEWLATQVPPNAAFQIYAFNDQARPVLEGTDGQWLAADPSDRLEQAVRELGRMLPTRGTSLYQAFDVANRLQPRPDTIYLITDGLPTQGRQPAGRGTVSPQRRLELFREAFGILPGNVPVNIILLPMEGDPMAASMFWQLAQITGGSMIAPSEDWP